MRHKLINFIREDIWLLHEQKLLGVQEKLIKSLKVIILSLQGFGRDLCLLRASALTLYSILSIVPVIAMLFGIAKGFGYEKILEQQLLEQAPNQDSLVLQLIGFAQNLLDSTKGEVVAGIGLVVLFWTVITLIGNIEESFNYIWKIAKGRPLGRKFSDYLSLMLLAPVLLIAASSITVFVGTQVTWLIGVMRLPEFGTWLVINALSLLPLLLMIGLFAFIFIFMPNHKINYRAGLIAGAVTGLIYHLLQWIYLSLQIGVSSYNAIYGSFAALPLFVVWLQSCWIVVLFGCEMAFFIQNYQTYRNNNRFSNLSFALKKFIALQVMHLIVKNFSQLNVPLCAAEIAGRLVAPIEIVQAILSKLISAHLIAELKGPDESEEIYLPAVDINILSIYFVINALEQCGQNYLPDSQQVPRISDALESFAGVIQSSAYNCLLKDI
ncbi:YihY/virulence factor BrkB family protein [Methylomonas sp. 2BW1-5-20]|uniref:YihY/virulence factor BrkB family protein n=1 Tax=Methylomonas sp. 2BW1-5-20 TaxID=3376686 RepID=UPI00404F0E47